MAETKIASAAQRRAKAEPARPEGAPERAAERAPERAIDEAVQRATEAAATRAAEVLAQAEKANAALAASLAGAEAMLASITAETGAALKARDAALAQMAEATAARVKEAEAANSLADQGVDVLTAHVDSPKVIVETAERRGIFSSGYHASQAELAPNGYLTGAEWNWEKVYTSYVETIQKGEKPQHLVRGGFSSGFVKLSPYGAAVSAELKTKAEEAKAALTAGTLVVYQGPLKDNAGKEVIPAGTKQAQTDITLESMSYLVEGVKGKLN